MRVLLCAFGIENLDYMLSTSKDLKYVLTTYMERGFITNMILVNFTMAARMFIMSMFPLIGVGLTNLPKYGEDRFSHPHMYILAALLSTS